MLKYPIFFSAFLVYQGEAKRIWLKDQNSPNDVCEGGEAYDVLIFLPFQLIY